jgi:diketogulonate reductase-like aldo/keto reductase
MTTTDYAEPAATLPAGRMPLLGFGTWQISNRDAVSATGHALEAGYRHIDTATAYGNEAGIGKALASAGLDRESVFVTTKLRPDHAGRERRTLSESLTARSSEAISIRLWSRSASSMRRIVAWHVAHGFVVIPKSVRPERIRTNAAGARIRLTPDEVAAIDWLSESATMS